MVRYMHDLPSCPSTLLMRYITMKRKHLILLTTLSLFAFSALPGCGCGAVQTSEPIQTETATVEPEATSQPEAEIQKESPSASEIAEMKNVESETEIASDETEAEETISENKAIMEMDAIMYATTAVNVRQESSVDSEKVGNLFRGEEVHVTGKTEDGLWMRIEEGEGEAFVASNYLSTEKPVVEEESPSTSESESTSSNGGSTGSDNSTGTTQAETPAPEQETVILEPAPAPEDLPEAPAPDNPSAWESLGEPEYTDGSEFAPTLGDGSNLGTGYEGQGTGMTWQ